MIKNKDVAHSSLSPAGRVAKRCTQSLRNAGVPRVKSLPHINLVAEGRSPKARCAAVLHDDLDNPYPKHRAETARMPGGSISAEPDQWEEDEDHCHRLLTVAQSWLEFEQLFPRRCADSLRTTEQARHDFCLDLVQSFSPSCSPTSSSSLVNRCSTDLADSVSFPSISSPHLSSATSSTSQTTVASTASEKPALSPKFSDEELHHESDNFPFRFSQEEEWTPEVESRMQDAIDRLLSDAMRQLASPVPNFSVQFPDDLLAESVAHKRATSRSGASSLEDYDSSYSADLEDEAEEDVGLVSLSPIPSSTAYSTTLVVDAVTIPVYSPTSLTSQATVASTVPEKPTQSPEFSDERESDNFSFHFSQEEEWTPEVESRMQNEINRMLSDAMRQLAIPAPKFTDDSDDSLADSVAHETAADPRPSRSGASSLENYNSSYSAYQEDEAEEDDGLVSLSPTPTSSPAYSTTLVIDAVTISVFPAQLSPSSQMDDRTSDEEQDDAESIVDIGHGIDNVWEQSATYVPRLLTRIPEESLADEFVVEEEAHSPLVSFKHAISLSSTHSDTTEVGSIPASTSSDTRVSFAPTAGKTLRRVRKFVDLKNPVTLPTLRSTSSINTLCETISVHEEDCQDRRTRSVPGCIDSDLRKAFGGSDVSIETSPSMVLECSLSGLGSCFSFEERRRLSDLEEGPKVQTTTKSSDKPPVLPIPPKPPDLYLRWKQRRWVADLDPTKPPIPPKPPDPYLRWKRQRWVTDLDSTKPPIPPKPPDLTYDGSDGDGSQRERGVKGSLNRCPR